MRADPVKGAPPIRFTSTRSKPMSPHPPRRPLLGIGLMLLGIFMFAVNDVLGKWLVGTYSVGQLLLLRSVAALLVLLPLLGRLGGGSVSAWPHPPLQLLRIVFSTLPSTGLWCFFPSRM